VNEQTFDRLARLVAQRTSRRAFLTTSAGIAAIGMTRQFARAATADASALVLSYYELVDAYRYDESYALLGSDWQSRQSLKNFTNGYGNTAFVQCDVLSAHSMRDRTVTVNVRLVSWHNDGSIAAYEGAYGVGAEGGELRILAGHNAVVDLPKGTAPLCTLNQLAFGLAPWDAGAGNRTSAVLATNTSNATCVVGGSPRLEITTGAFTVRSDSQTGSPPTGIVLGSGDSAQAPLRFGDWCESTNGKMSVTVELPGDPGVGKLNPGKAGISYPPCLGAGQAALLEVNGWLAYAP
jgi:hypothetical protein